MRQEEQRLSAADAEVWRARIRDLIKHEDELVNQRIGWLMQVQGLLFAALGFAWGNATFPLIALLACLGIATALSIWSAISLYSPAVHELREWWKKHRPADAFDGPDIIGLWLPSSYTGKLLRPWRAMPLIFILAWAGVVAISWVFPLAHIKA